jgi:hypothetical protein
MEFIDSNIHLFRPDNAAQYFSKLHSIIVTKIKALKNSEDAVNSQKQSFDDKKNPNHSTLEKVKEDIHNNSEDSDRDDEDDYEYDDEEDSCDDDEDSEEKQLVEAFKELGNTQK